MASLLSKRLSGEPVSKVEVHVSCDKLLNRDVTSKSDPCCLLYMMTDGKWLEVSVVFFVQILSEISSYCGCYYKASELNALLLTLINFQ